MLWTGISIQILLSVLSFLLIAAVTFAVARWLRGRLRVMRDRAHTLHIRHQANFRAFYYLAVESAEPALRFQLLAGKIPLLDVSQPAPKMETATAALPVKQTPQALGQADEGNKSATLGGAVNAGRKVAGKAGAVAGMMGALGNILPGRLGARFKEQEAAAKKVQVDTVRTTQAPVDMQKKMEAAQYQGGKLGIKTPAGSAPPSTANPPPAPVMGDSHAAVDSSPANIVQPLQPSLAGVYCAQTTEVSPGQTLPLTLNIGTYARRYPAGSFAYTIRMQTVSVEPLQDQPPLLFKRGTVFFEPVAHWRYWMPNFSSVVVVLSGLIAWLYLTTLIWK